MSVGTRCTCGSRSPAADPDRIEQMAMATCWTRLKIDQMTDGPDKVKQVTAGPGKVKQKVFGFDKVEQAAAGHRQV